MPMVEGKHINPSDAVKDGYCPETGESLKGDDIEARIARLWPGTKSPEAEERIAMLRAYDANQKTEPAKE